MDRTNNRRGKITPEHLEEARRLRAIWQATKDVREASMSQSELFDPAPAGLVLVRGGWIRHGDSTWKHPNWSTA